jgi:hypothetical protein
MRIPTRDAKGAAMAITAGRAKSTRRTTWLKGTRLVRISWARSRSWFTKKIKKKKRKETKKENSDSAIIYLNSVQDVERELSAMPLVIYR